MARESRPGTCRIGKYEEGHEDGYVSVMNNTGQSVKKNSIRTAIFERVDHGC